MKRAVIAAGLIMLAANLQAADEKIPSDAPQDYANKLTIESSGTMAAQGMARIKLPLAVYRGVANADLRDVRVFNAKGERVPFALTTEPDRSVAARTLVALPIFPEFENSGASAVAGGVSLTVKLQADGTLVSLNSAPKAATSRRIKAYLVDASQMKTPISALNVDWQKNANAETGRVTIEASSDFKNWRIVARHQPLIDMAFNGETLTQKRVEFTPPISTPTDKYLRLTWAGEAFTLTKLEAESVANNIERVTETVTVNGVAGNKAGEYEFDIGARLPIERVRLLLPDANSLAPTQLFVKATMQERKPSGKIENIVIWQPVTSATFYRLTRDGVEIISPPVSVANANARGANSWKASIDARGGGIGSGLPKLEVTWQPQHLVFTARGDAPFTLAFGRADAKAANFAINDLLPGYTARAEFQLPLVNLQTTGDVPVVAPPTKISNDTDWKKIALWAVLVIGVALMAWMAMRLGRDVGSSSEK